jgi:hypothetical protein
MYRSTFLGLGTGRLVVNAGHFTSGEGAHGTDCIGGWVGPRASLKDMEKKKLRILPGLELQPFVTILTTLSELLYG